jgi:NAD-dependent dihydropyrimidine dehydrogenase PreA subunit
MNMKTTRPIIQIDEEKCTGCGLCVPSCAEGALAIVDGKARLVKEIFCDGLGACLGDCPEGALTVIEREADPFDEAAVEAHIADQIPTELAPHFGGCPGSALREFARPAAPAAAPTTESTEESALTHWPVQLMLVPPHAPFLKGADVLLTADCVPFALPGYHERYLKGRVVLVACPKLDDLALYQRKLADIFAVAQPRTITVLRMQVPCCGGLSQAAAIAHRTAESNARLEVHTISVEGEVTHIDHAAGPGAAADAG